MYGLCCCASKSADHDIIPLKCSGDAKVKSKFLVYITCKLKQQFAGSETVNRSCDNAVQPDDQEASRRAELKRMQRKRIQDELNGSGAMTDRQTPLRSNQHSTQSFKVPLWAIGPRDTLEFSIATDDQVTAFPKTIQPASTSSNTQRDRRCNSFPGQSSANDVLSFSQLPRKTVSLNFSSKFTASLPAAPKQAHYPALAKTTSHIQQPPALNTIIGPQNCFLRGQGVPPSSESGMSLWLLSTNDRCSSVHEGTNRPTMGHVANGLLTIHDMNGIDGIVEMPFPSWDGVSIASIEPQTKLLDAALNAPVEALRNDDTWINDIFMEQDLEPSKEESVDCSGDSAGSSGITHEQDVELNQSVASGVLKTLTTRDFEVLNFSSFECKSLLYPSCHLTNDFRARRVVHVPYNGKHKQSKLLQHSS